jgi:hypothetical protein
MASPAPSPYDRAYYAQYRSTGRRSADVIAEIVNERHRPRSVIDVGCGEGYFLDAFRTLGAEETVGVDGPFNDGAIVREHGHEFVTVDLDAAEPAIDRTFDLAICLEVAEHLRPDRSEAVVAMLVGLARVVLFSAAIPLQHGERHINLRPQSYWIERFAAHGYRAGDVIRPRIWDDARVSWWYRQNALIFSPDETGDVPLPDVVHPELLREGIESARNRSGTDALRLLRGAVARRLRLRR